MKKTTKKVSTTKVTAKKAAPVKKITKEKDETKKTAVVKKSVVKKTEPVSKVVKKLARKKEVTQKIVHEVKPEVKHEPVKTEVKEVKVERVKFEAVKLETPKKVVVAQQQKLAEQKPFVAHVAPKVERVAAKPRAVSRRSSTLAQGVGRRKSAVARVWLKLGTGKLTVNDNTYEQYFTMEVARLSATMPFRVIAKAQNYDVFANVNGGGVCAQADAVKLGFVRALLELNAEWRAELRKAGLLTVDSRQKERKKYGQKGARRKFQFVKR